MQQKLISKYLRFFIAKWGIFIIKCDNYFALILSQNITVITKNNLTKYVSVVDQTRINQCLAIAKEKYRSFYEGFDVKVVCPDI